MVAHSTGADDHVDLWTWPAKSKEGPGQLRRIDIPVATLDIDCVIAAVPVSTQFWKWSDFHFHVTKKLWHCRYDKHRVNISCGRDCFVHWECIEGSWWITFEQLLYTPQKQNRPCYGDHRHSGTDFHLEGIVVKKLSVMIGLQQIDGDAGEGWKDGMNGDNQGLAGWQGGYCKTKKSACHNQDEASCKQW